MKFLFFYFNIFLVLKSSERKSSMLKIGICIKDKFIIKKQGFIFVICQKLNFKENKICKKNIKRIIFYHKQ